MSNTIHTQRSPVWLWVWFWLVWTIGIVVWVIGGISHADGPKVTDTGNSVHKPPTQHGQQPLS